MIQITYDQLNPASVTESVRHDGNGAVVTFLGTTRGTSQGAKVLYLEYEAYEPMAIKELERITSAVSSKWNIKDIKIAHRLGRVNISDISLIVAVASPHRKEAFEACQYAVDMIKLTVPIWKKEVFEDGAIWVGCQYDSQPLESTGSTPPPR